MNSCVDRVEALVADSLRASQGSCALEASAAVEAAVHRARAKGKLLRHLDSGLLLSAAQEAEEEVGSLLRVTDINAEAMQEVSATAGAGFLAAEEEEKTASVRTQAGEPAPATELGSADDSASAVSLPSSQAPASGAGWDCAEVATRVVAPLRLLAAEIQAEESQADPSSMALKRFLRLRKDTSTDLQTAQEVDFDQCYSPRAAGVAVSSTPRIQGRCLAFGADTAGKALQLHPLDTGLDQFQPMSPIHAAAQQEKAPGSASPVRDAAQAEGAGGEGIRFGATGQGSPVCQARVPPGLNPLTHVEGSVLREQDVGLSEDAGADTFRWVHEGGTAQEIPQAAGGDVAGELGTRLQL